MILNKKRNLYGWLYILKLYFFWDKIKKRELIQLSNILYEISLYEKLIF